jgi:signal transduction histidine kinase
MRFLWFIGAFALLFLMAMGGLAYLLTQLFGGDGQTAMLVWLAGCGLALTFPLLVVTLAMRSFRGYADPLARVMAAADAVAEGDLSVRVPESGPGEIGRLARSFNRMVTELQHSDELRRSLTADVAHELRTPLHILQGNLEGILDGVYAPTPEHINLLIDEIRQLSRLVEDLRTLSLAEAGQLDMVMGPVDVAELISDAATSFSGQAEAAGLSLRVDVKTGDQPLFVTGDADRLDQVLGNLLANALRHTRSGGRITLCAEAMPGGVRIQVSDDGAGISPEDLPHIFERYWHGNTESEEAGSGLGLAIARQLVQAHNGHISVESQPGQGATFTIELTQFTG